MNDELAARIRPLVGIIAGAIIGGALYGLSRSILPGAFAFSAVAAGTLAGLGARLFGAIGSPAQLRVLVFAALFATLIGEFAAGAVLAHTYDLNAFAVRLLDDPMWLVFAVLFLVVGIFFGVRLLVGTDALADVLEHASDAAPFGVTGMACPTCDSRRTRLDPRTLMMQCEACEHTWRPVDEHPAAQ